MIAFIEGGIRIPMGRVTRDFLITHRLCPTQCSPNLFRILGSVDTLNEKMGVNLTDHNVNWVYNCQHLKSMGYYLKTRVPKVRLISCLLESNKGINANLNRHALRPNKNIEICCEPQSTRFETQQKYWNTCPTKLKFIF